MLNRITKYVATEPGFQKQKLLRLKKIETEMQGWSFLLSGIFTVFQRPERFVGVRLKVRGMKERNGGGRNNKVV